MNNTIQKGSTGQLVVLLQQFLNCHGHVQAITGFFGPVTDANLRAYQSENGLPVTGILDQNLITLISAPTKLDAFCHAIQIREGFIAPCPQYPHGTPAWFNNNPGNLTWAGQQNATQNGRFAKFATYTDGYNALKTLLIRAFSGQGKIYNANGTIYDFFAKYAPSSDNNDPKSYAEQVAKFVGVPPTTVIKTLLS